MSTNHDRLTANLGAWAVHLLTASGAALGLFAALAAALHVWQWAFALLAIAQVIDGVDGPAARYLGVHDRLPWIDGALLDLVVDYTTYVFVPALVILDGWLLGPPWGAVASVIVILTSAIYFADGRMETPAAAFRGFPAVWNAIVFQLMVYQLGDAANLAIIALCAALTFVPVEFVHPVRVKQWRPLTLAMAALWSVLGIIALIENFDAPLWLKLAFGAVSLYFALVGAVQQWMRARS